MNLSTVKLSLAPLASVLGKRAIIHVTSNVSIVNMKIINRNDFEFMNDFLLICL